MTRRLLRTLLALATFTVVWLVVSPTNAFAATSGAPVCDPRGAIVFAPPPQIQDPETSLDIPADCFDVNPFETRNVGPDRGTPPQLGASLDPMTASPGFRLDLVFSERLPVRIAVVQARPAGVRLSVDRPPRA